MALRGNLRDFSLPDVFQLVTFSRKTGVLRITSESGAQGSVWFRDGEVFFASSNWHTDLLGQRLVRAQRITPQALNRSLELRAAEPESGRRLGQILVDEGYITEAVLEAFVQEQIQDTIFDLMRWDEGEFDFEAMPEVVDEDIGLVVSIENVVMEGSRRLEEWNRIRRKIPSMEVVFKMATAPGEGTFEISLKPTEWQLLLLVDSTRSVSELARETGRTDFEVARVLYGLFSAGLLEFATDEEIERNRAERTAREAKLAELEAERRAAREAAERTTPTPQAGEASAGEPGTDEQSEKVVSAPAEVPSFLGVGSSAPTEDDQAALEEFMGAVLEQPREAAVEPEPEPEPAPQPYTPVEEPAFMSEAAQEADTSTAPETLIEDLLGLTPQPVPEPVHEPQGIAAAMPEVLETEPVVEVTEVEPTIAPTVEPEPAVEVTEVEPTVEPEPVLEAAAIEPPIEPPIEPEPLLPSAAAPADADQTAAGIAESDLGFERDLMALGLGELPSDLLEFAEREQADQTETVPADVLEIAIEPAPEEIEPAPEILEWLEEPEQAAVTPTADVTEPPAEEVEELLIEEVEPVIEFESEIETVVEAAPSTSAAEEMDFSALIESLDVDADDFTDLDETTAEVAPAERGFDEGLLRDESPVVPGKVISTDAFLSDITMDDLGFSGGMTDELSALTGVQRRGGSRPQASINRLPEEGSAVLRRDARVDKDTLLKIIDGIQNL